MKAFFFCTLGMSLKLRCDLIEVDIQRADDVEQRIHVDAFLGDLAQRSVLQLCSGEVVLDDVKHGIADDAFGGGEIADAHFDDPAFFGGQCPGIPVLHVARHVDHIRFPMVGLHLFVDAVGLVIFQRQHVQFGAAVAIDHALAGETLARFGFVETEGFGAELIDDEIALFTRSVIGILEKKGVVSGYDVGGYFRGHCAHGFSFFSHAAPTMRVAAGAMNAKDCSQNSRTTIKLNVPQACPISRVTSVDRADQRSSSYSFPAFGETGSPAYLGQQLDR